MNEPEYTDEEYAAEMERARVWEARSKLTAANLAAYLQSDDAKKRRRHAANYAFKGYRSFRLSSRSPNLSNWPKGPIDCRVPQGDPTEYERTHALVLRHFSEAMKAHCDFIPKYTEGNLGYGIIVGYSGQSRSIFQSFNISHAIKQTIKEHYEKTNR